MPLQRKEIEIPLNGGLDVKQSTELQEANTLRTVTNFRFDALGELRKRPYYASEAVITPPSGSNYSDDGALTIFGRERDVCALTDHFGVVTVDPTDPSDILYQRREVGVASSGSSSVLKYAPRGCRVSRRFVERSQMNSAAGIYQVASAAYGDVLVFAWIELGVTTLVKMKAIDINTGTVLSQAQYAAVTTALTADINAVPYYQSGSEGVLISYASAAAAPFTINTVRYVASTGEFTADSTLTTNSRYASHSLTTDQPNGKIYVSYADDSGSFPLLVKYGTIAQINGGTGTTHTANHTAVSASVVIGTIRVLIASCSTTDAYAEVFGTPANVITVFPASGETFHGATAALDYSAGNFNYAVAYFNGYGTGTPATHRVRTAAIDFSATTPVEGNNGYIPNASAACGAFTYDTRAHGIFSLDPDAERPTSLVVARYAEHSPSSSVTRHDPIARLCHDRFFSSDLGVFGSSNSVSIVDDRVHIVLPADRSEAESANSSGLYLAQSLFHSTIDFDAPVPSVEVDGTALLASGLVIEHDGDVTSEHAPLTKPRCFVIIESSAGNLSADITDSMSVRAVYRWVDARGRLHRSAPSDAATVTVPVDSATQRIDVRVTIPPFSAYDKDTTETTTQWIEPELYVTADGGAVYRLAATLSGYKHIPTSTGPTTWRFEDVLPANDAMPQLYSDGTGGSEIVPEPPPSLLHITRIGDRLWGIDAEDRTRVWYTKPLASGYAPEWSSICTLTIGDNGVAVTSLGGNPTFLCERGIWQVYGDGPDALGNGTFTPAQRIANECTCIDPLSVCRTPMGVVFRGRKGFYVINDGGQVSAFGLPIDPTTRATTLDDYSYCRVLFDEVHNEIRVIDRSSSHYYVYNVVEQKWSEWGQSSSAQNAIDATVVDGRVWYLHRNGSSEVSIRREYDLDEEGAASTESTGIVTPWYRLDGVAGFGRLWEVILQLKLRSSDGLDTIANVNSLSVIVETKGPHGAGPIGTDYDTFSWTGAQLADIGTSDEQVIELRMKPRHQNCKAFRLYITESCTSGYSGSSPVALRAILGVDGRAIKRSRSGANKGAA